MALSSHKSLLQKIQNDAEKHMKAIHTKMASETKNQLETILAKIMEKIWSDYEIHSLLEERNAKMDYCDLMDIYSIMYYFPKVINDKNVFHLREFPKRFKSVLYSKTNWNTKFECFSQISCELREKLLSYTGCNMFITNLGPNENVEANDLYSIVNEMTTCVNVYQLSHNSYLVCNLSPSDTSMLVDCFQNKFLKFDDGSHSGKMQVTKIQPEVQTRKTIYNWKYKMEVMCFYNYHHDKCIPINTIVEKCNSYSSNTPSLVE